MVHIAKETGVPYHEPPLIIEKVSKIATAQRVNNSLR